MYAGLMSQAEAVGAPVGAALGTSSPRRGPVGASVVGVSVGVAVGAPVGAAVGAPVGAVCTWTSYPTTLLASDGGALIMGSDGYRTSVLG